MLAPATPASSQYRVIIITLCWHSHVYKQFMVIVTSGGSATTQQAPAGQI